MKQTSLEIEGLDPQAAAAPPPHSQGKHEDEISLVDILIVAGRRKRFILRFTLVCMVLGVVISLVLPKEYTAETTILPPQQASSMASALMSQLGNLGSMASLAGGSLGLKNPNDMHVAMFKSRTVEDAMIRQYGLMAEYKQKYLSTTRKKFEKYFTVDGSSKDGLIHISVEDRNPQRAAEMANGYVAQYRKLSETLAIGEAAQRRLFFQQQLEQAKDNLANAEEALKVTEQTTGLIQLDSQARALIESAAALRAQIAAKEVQLQAMQTYATSENSSVVEVQQELDGLKTQLARLGGSKDSGSDGLIVPKGQVPQAGLEYVRRLRDVKYYETIFQILARQFELAKLDEAREGALVQVVDPATVPDRKSSPQRALIIVGATFAGLFLGTLFALLREGWERMQQNPEERDRIEMLKSVFGRERRTTSKL